MSDISGYLIVSPTVSYRDIMCESIPGFPPPFFGESLGTRLAIHHRLTLAASVAAIRFEDRFCASKKRENGEGGRVSAWGAVHMAAIDMDNQTVEGPSLLFEFCK